MFFIPYSTDAPLYYRPFVTIALIAANVAAFVMTRMGEAADGWLLQFGQGLHPTEWFASAFLHFGVPHLLGNMLFLWTFGLIVEGKLGWWRFLLLYLLLCGLDGAVTQTVMLSYDGDSPGAGGASGVIFALMAIALFWADGDGTYTPPGHWNVVAQTVAVQEGNSLVENARLFALLNIALADAGIGRGAFQAAFCGTVYSGVAAGHKVLTSLGLSGVPMVNVEAGCASGGAALALGAAQSHVWTLVLTRGLTLAAAGISGFSNILNLYKERAPLRRNVDTSEVAEEQDLSDEAVACLTRFAKEHKLSASQFTALGAFRDCVLGYFDWEKKDYMQIPIVEQVEVLVLCAEAELVGLNLDLCL